MRFETNITKDVDDKQLGTSESSIAIGSVEKETLTTATTQTSTTTPGVGVWWMIFLSRNLRFLTACTQIIWVIDQVHQVSMFMESL